MESAGTGGDVDGDRLAIELSGLRAAVDDLRRRPLPLDADTLRHVVTASFSEANAPPPNLLVTAIRRLDRLDARLESIEAALGSQGPLPAVGAGARSRPVASSASVASASYAPPAPDAEAIAEALARRLSGMLPNAPASGPAGGAATVADLVSALRPLLPGAARSVLRRAGREPSAQAVEVLHQAALAALEEAAGSLGPFAAPAFAARPALVASPPALAFAAPVAAQPVLAPAPQAPSSAPPPPLDVEALASTIAVRVTASVAASVARQLTVPQPAAVQANPPPPDTEAPPPVDPVVVAEAVVARLAEQPPPQAVVSAMAMAPLLSAVGNVEAAVAQLAEPEADVVGALGRLEAGIDALARALEEDRGAQADEVRRGFTEVTDLVRNELATQVGPVDWGPEPAGEPGEEGEPGDGQPDQDRTLAAVLVVQRRLERVSRQLAPLDGADLSAISGLPGLEGQGRRLERSIGNILTALAALVDHIQEESTALRTGLEDIASAVRGQPGPGQANLASVQSDLGALGTRLDDLVAGTAADRQRFQRLGGSIDGLAELLGLVSERLDGLTRLPEARSRAVPPPVGDHGAEEVPAEEVPAEEVPAEEVPAEEVPAEAPSPSLLADAPPRPTDDDPLGIDDPADPLLPGPILGSARRRRRRGTRRNLRRR